MARDTRQRMIAQAALLFRGRGYAGTGIREIAEAAGANRGVIYHHFPGGKAEVATEVLASVDSMVSPAIAAVCATQDPVPAMHAILAATKFVMTGGEQPPGCTVAAITLGAGPDEPALHTLTRDIFRRWRTPFRECLQRNGFDDDTATNLATLLIAGMEGALVLCRAEDTTEPLDQVAAALEHALTRTN
ncbi:TetR/AcrR family transcriptional regulator [Nocardia huaxiensis]|uniref:TetR/AcrR family transcriptional regulator n=1 Tax=Nocardia huaxiensis TaxID=2755382 RepID=A0A7D6Z1I5_9NOCA|nr:TetR/AcrR family transcriptional regulator [Nocardia huaxiensis]QLY28304.1 TetR/AcrR family transcriptional regulator [Nocardia huaxiensis]UFS98257.1 TetR/AcrR family transcriptional regulator [Nocardia huaxiensis]